MAGKRVEAASMQHSQKTPPFSHRPIQPRPESMRNTHLRRSDRRMICYAEKKTRAGKPKVRTGCQTCKIRRVKCDETKPICLRCQRLKIECQGYSTPLPKAAKPVVDTIRNAPPRLIAPKDPLALSTQPSLQSPFLADSIPSSPSFLLLDRVSSKDALYFDFFRHSVLNNLAGFYTTSIWSRLVAGDGLQEKCIYHSIIAVGAFLWSANTHPYLSSQEVSKSLIPTLFPDIDVHQHRNVALRHHIKATVLLREQVHCMASTSPNAVITTTLLLAVFELLQGRPQEASSLVKSTINFFEDLTAQLDNQGTLALQGMSTREFKDVVWVLPSISMINDLSHLLRPHPHNITFCRTETSFDFPVPELDPISHLHTCWGRFFTLSIMFLHQSVCRGLETTSASTTVQFALQQETLIAHLETWKSILEDYTNQPETNSSGSLALRLVHIHWLMLRISISCCLDPSQVIYDLFEDEFRFLTTLCSNFIRDSSSHQPPTSVLLGNSLILPLCVVVRSCRNHNIRMRGVETIRSIPSSMVAWDTEKMLRDLLEVVFLEEIGRNDAGYIPTELRILWLDDGKPVESNTFATSVQSLTSDVLRETSPERRKLQGDRLAEICHIAGCDQNHADDWSTGSRR